MAQRRNVQQQNELALKTMLDVAVGARDEGLPAGVERFLTERGIDLTASAVISIQTERSMLGLEHGLAAVIVAPGPRPRIWEFELELDESGENVLAAAQFTDATDAFNFSRHNPGIGWGRGALAVEAMRRLNETSPPPSRADD